LNAAALNGGGGGTRRDLTSTNMSEDFWTLHEVSAGSRYYKYP